MAKSKQKGKGPRRSGGGLTFNEDALAKLTSRIDHSLTDNDHKRKRPPTNASPAHMVKKQRNSDAEPVTHGSKTDQEALLAEILALGGDEDDLELINGIDSDDELVGESKAPVDKKLRDELEALSKKLGFSEFVPQEASEASEDEDGEEAEREEVEDEEGDEDDDDQEKEKIPESRHLGNLVCESNSSEPSLTSNAIDRPLSPAPTGMPTNLRSCPLPSLKMPALCSLLFKLLSNTLNLFWKKTPINIEPVFSPQLHTNSCLPS